MDHKSIAIKIMQKLGYEVKRTKDKSKGCDHKIILLYTNKGNFVYRFCKNDKAIMSHAWACKVWKDLPVPKTIIKKKHYLIETMIKGKDMSESKLTREQKLKIMKDLGKILKKMHKVHTKRYGYLIAPGIGQVNSWKKYIMRLANSRLKKIKLESSLLKKTKAYLKKNDFLLDFKNPILLHKDINPENIMIKNHKLEGIIDIGDAVSGDPIYEIATMYDRFRNYERIFPDTLVKSYGKINQKRLRFYEVTNVIRRIWIRKQQGKPIKKYIKRLESFLS